MNIGCGERVRNGWEGRRKGPPAGAVTGVIDKETLVCITHTVCAYTPARHNIHSVCAHSSPAARLTPPLRTPSKTTERALGVQL